MSGATYDRAAFVAYWESEGENYARQGDYAWMASLAPGKRILEIGCGVGFGTAALVARGAEVLALDFLDECLEATRHRVGAAAVTTLRADIAALDDTMRETLAGFQPETVVCWLLGAPSDVTDVAGTDPQQAVAAYRARTQRQVAELAVALPTVSTLHFVDRTAIPWQGKDLARETLVRYHLLQTLSGLPFAASRDDALYRKLAMGGDEVAALRRSHPALKSVTPALASLLARRTP